MLFRSHFLPTQEIPFSCLRDILFMLVIRDANEAVKQSGITDTLTLRERFWILRGREAVEQLIRRCVICRRYEGLSYKYLTRLLTFPAKESQKTYPSPMLVWTLPGHCSLQMEILKEQTKFNQARCMSASSLALRLEPYT